MSNKINTLTKETSFTNKEVQLKSLTIDNEKYYQI